VFYSNFVPKTHLFEIFDFKNAVTLKTGLGVRQCRWKYHNSIDRIRLLIDVLYYGSISCRFGDIQRRKMSWPWNHDQGSLKVIENGTIWTTRL